MSLTVTIAFIALMFFIGILRTGRPDTASKFFVSGRDGNTLRITGSLVATIIGGSATLGVAGLGFTMGLPAAWWLLSGSVFLVILGVFFADRVRKLEVYTLPEVLYAQYGSGALRIIASVVIITAWLGIIGAQIAAAGRIMNILWPGHFTEAAIICGSTFIVYTMIGGQRSVIRTDLFQAVLIFCGICLLLIILFLKSGAPWNLTLPEGHINFPVNSRFGYSDILSYFLFVGTSYLAGPDMYSRILSAKDEKTAGRSAIMAALIVAILALAITSIGVYGKALYPAIEPESVFPVLIMEQLPELIKGIVVASLIAAFLSSANTCLITSCIILEADIINPLLFKGAMTDKSQVLLTRALILLIGALSIAITIYLGGIIKSMLFALTLYTTGLIIPVILGFYREKLKLNRYGAIAAVLTGSSSAMVLKQLTLNKYLILVFPAVVAVFFTVSYIMREEKNNPE